jgi:hypothetical protein
MSLTLLPQQPIPHPTLARLVVCCQSVGRVGGMIASEAFGICQRRGLFLEEEHVKLYMWGR